MKKILLFVCVCLLISAGTVSAVDPIWSNTVEDTATTTALGGEIVGGPESYVAGSHGQAFAGNSSAYAAWDNADVAAIFDGGWNDALGSTVDLYFAGSSITSSDSGLWSVVDRYGGSDSMFIVQLSGGSIRAKYVGSNGNNHTALLTSVPLANDTIYRLTVSQVGTVMDIYLDGGAYSNAAPVYTGAVSGGTVAFPDWNDGSSAGGREMSVGTRSFFWPDYGGLMQQGDWVDSIRVYNGAYTPAEIGEIPEPATMLLLGLGGLALIRRRKA